MESEINRMEMGDDLVLMVARMMVFWMTMMMTRNTDMAVTVVSIRGVEKLVLFSSWLLLNITSLVLYYMFLSRDNNTSIRIQPV